MTLRCFQKNEILNCDGYIPTDFFLKHSVKNLIDAVLPYVQ